MVVRANEAAAEAGVTVEHRQMPNMLMRANIAPTSLNEEKRTVDMVFTAGGMVLRYDWEMGVRFWEKLSTNPKHVRLGRLNSGAPLLNSHRGYDLDDVVGVVVANTVRLTGEEGHLTVRFADADDAEAEKIFRKVKGGIIQNVSVGYQVYRYEDVGTHEDGKLIRLATDWEPYEVSAVAMGADSGAGFRSAQESKDGKQVQTNTVEFVTRSQLTEGEPTMKLDANGQPIVERAAPATPAAAPTTTVVDENAVRTAAVAQERDRVAGIRQACRAGKLDEAFENDLVERGVALDEARKLVLEKLATPAGTKTDTPGAVRVSMSDDHNERAVLLRGMENALEHRSNPGGVKLTDEGRMHRADSLLDMAKATLELHGVSTRGMSKGEIAVKALTLRAGYHTTSDFSNTLANVANKSLRAGYDQQEQTFKVFSRQKNLPDYKIDTINQLGEAPELKRVMEGAEYTRGTMGEGKEQWQLLKYGRVFAITREVIVNDDLDAFTRMPGAFGASASDLESDLAYAQITGNPTMGDGIALFHASHNNLATGGGSALSFTSLEATRTRLRKQKALDGKQRLNIPAKYLLVPAALETAAEKLIGSDLQSAGNDLNVFKNKQQIIVESRLDDNSATAWYNVADAARIDTMVYGYLQGEEGPQMEQRVGFDVDGLEIKCRLDFAAKVIEYRAFQKNVGA